MNACRKNECPAATGQVVQESTDTSIIAVAEKTGRIDKAFAMHGHTVHRADPSDGAVTYWAERWGPMDYLLTLADAQHSLVQNGGLS